MTVLERMQRKSEFNTNLFSVATADEGEKILCIYDLLVIKGVEEWIWKLEVVRPEVHEGMQ